MDGLTVLTNIALILLLGLLCTLLAKKMRISNMLLLVLMGILLKFLALDGNQLFTFSPDFLIAVSILAIVMIVFDSTSRIKWKEFDEFSVKTLELVGWFTLVLLVIMSFFAMLLIYGSITLTSLFYAMIFASIMVATDPSALFVLMGSVKHKTIALLELESIINTPLTVILPFIILDFLTTVGDKDILSSFLYQIMPFLQQIIVGIGAGVVIGIVIFKIMRNFYSEQLSPIAFITAALLAYIMSANMGGSGVLAVATLGLFFGSVYVKQKAALQEFSYLLSNSLEIMVFVLVGLVVVLPLEITFYVKSITLFIVLLLSRVIAVFYTLNKSKFNLKEKMFISLNMPKGIAMAVVVFSLSIMNINEINMMLDYLLAILVYSLVLSTFVTKLSKKFITLDIQKEIEKSTKVV
ncbi:cation:proton antiporter [Nanoarchaeota archaeon]